MNKRIDVTISHDQTKTDFFNHLRSPDNSRVLFSAPYGSGKSTFIKEFFQGANDDFCPINLYPVNYASASNNDVFELIKFDILTELIIQHLPNLPTAQSEQFSAALKAQVFLMDGRGINNFLKNLISATGEIGKSAISILEAFETLTNDFSDFDQQASGKDELSIKEFLSHFRKTKGTAYEMDDISQIIKKCLDELKSHNENLKTVLVIDDLDRLDPEHVFRLFNVFSAHFDARTDENKFGFDKVIFVCDIQNIHRMYQHRYGAEVSFFGYINKFYTSAPYHFDAQERLKERLSQILGKKPWKCDLAIAELYNDEGFQALLNHTLYSLIDQNLLTIRTLDQSPCYKPNERHSILPSTRRKSSFPAILFEFYTYIDYLRSFYPDLNILRKHLLALSAAYAADHLADRTSGGPEKEFLDKYVASACLIFLLPSTIVFSGNSSEAEQQKKRFNMGERIFMNYIFRRRSTPPTYLYPEVESITYIPAEGGAQRVDLDIFKILLRTLDVCISKGIIK